jgi:hypothetical protein
MILPQIAPPLNVGVPEYHGVPEPALPALWDLLAEAERLLGLGRSPAEAARAGLHLARNLGRLAPPLYSPGGLADCLDAVLGRRRS